MRNLLFIFVIAALLQVLLPWWWIAAPVGFAIGFWAKPSSGAAFWQGFLAIALLWLAYSLLIDWRTEAILSQRIAQMFMLPNRALLLLIVSLIGGLIGGFSALAGSLSSQVWHKN